MRTRVLKEKVTITPSQVGSRRVRRAGPGTEAVPDVVIQAVDLADEEDDDETETLVVAGPRESVDEEPEEDTEPAKAKITREEPSNFLSMYFRDMAQLAVLRPQEEFESARRLESLEIALWVQLLSLPPMAEHMMKLCERSLSEDATKLRNVPEFKAVRRLLGGKKQPPRADREKFDRAVVRAAESLRVLDSDRLAVEAAMRELRIITRGELGRLVDDRLTLPIDGKVFRAYLAAVASAFMRVQQAKNQFVSANLRLVVSIARRFNFGRMPLADLIQEGNIGLIKAVERFDHRRGYRFSTYASWWIRHAISRALADKGRAVRLPVHMIDAYHRLGKARKELQGVYGRMPTTEELEAKSGIPAAKIEKMKTFLTDQSFSLDRPVNDEDGRLFIDFVTDPNDDGQSTDDMMVGETMSTEVRSQLAHLRPIEADILRQRFGFDNDEELTLKEIGEKYNLSRERIRQLQEQALDKMRRALQRKDLM